MPGMENNRVIISSELINKPKNIDLPECIATQSGAFRNTLYTVFYFWKRFFFFELVVPFWRGVCL